MDSNDPETVEGAFRKRLMRDVPQPEPDCLRGLADFVKQYCKIHLRPVVPYTFEDWLAATSYNEERKQQLREARSKFTTRPSKRACSAIDTFVKTESYPEFKHARMINSRRDVFKAYSGPFFKAIEDVVYKLPEFIKHVPVPERPAKVAALRRTGLNYWATDFTAFESHFTVDIMNACELELYRYCLGYSEDAEFICSVISGMNRMRTRSGIKASVRARRMSGDMCTSLGNGWTNLMLAKYIASMQGCDLNGYVEGDDGLFATTAILTPELYARLGFTIKIESVTDPCAASFCGMIFADDGQIIKEPRAVFRKFGWTNSMISAGRKTMMGLLRAKALSSIYETPNCPITGQLARSALQYTEGYMPIFEKNLYKEPPPDFAISPYSPSPSTRELYNKLYGINPETQIKIEKLIRHGKINEVSSYLHPTADDNYYNARYVYAE